MNPSRILKIIQTEPRITTKDDETSKKQIEALRDLIDAGVFVYSSGKGPRTKTRDSDPIQQFKLSFRKIYGLASYIGLADRDRFELSGDELAKWLQSPTEAKDILLRNQIKKEIEDSDSNQDDLEPEKIEFTSALNTITDEIRETVSVQKTLFDSIADANINSATNILPKKINVSIESIKDYSNFSFIDSVLIGLGFEERTIASNKLLSSIVSPKQLFAVEYSEPGNRTIIEGFWEHSRCSMRKLSYCPDGSFDFDLGGVALIDITGLAKPIIFKSIRSELLKKGVVYVSYTPATVHYPLQKDIDKVMIDQRGSDPTSIFEGMASLLKGEDGPYTLCKLLDEDIDPSRNRFLFAFASAKHERIFTLLDNREYDALEIIAPTGDTPRAKLSLIAANYLVENYPNGILSTFDTNDLEGLLAHLDERYLCDYSIRGANIEIGLTGSKIQAVAAAILSSRRKIAQAWYVSPHKFDPTRFTSGVEETLIFKIAIQ